MKRWIWMVVCLLLLTGCAAEETFETVADELALPVMAQPREIEVALPGEAALPAMENDSCRLYLGSDYEILLQTLSGGDMARTIRQVSGFEAEELTVLETSHNDFRRVEFVWVSAGEQGDEIGRCVVLDDGDYHYCLSVLRNAEETENSQTNWNQVFDSFTLV